MAMIFLDTKLKSWLIKQGIYKLDSIKSKNCCSAKENIMKKKKTKQNQRVGENIWKKTYLVQQSYAKHTKNP